MYVLTSSAEDVETQRKGLVMVIYQPAQNAKVCTHPQERENVFRIMETIPVRISAVHLCIPDNSISRMIKAVMLVAIGPDRRARTRFHKGMCM
jgi:hypothetical protein